jgi:predicted dehydrogenase
LKALVVGYGSIGKRHIENLSDLFKISVTVCTNRKPDYFLKKRKCDVIKNIQDCVFDNIDFAIIANESYLHVKTALFLANKKIPFILEKPLSYQMNNIKKLNNIIKKNHLVTLMACNLRFHPCLMKIKDLLNDKKIGKIISVKVENGSYLPEWHPNENYRKSYASRKELGGGVVLTSIHEIDYLYWFFGNIKEVVSITGKFSNLDINSNDLSSSLLRFKNNVVSELHLDYFQQSPARSCKIIGTTGIIYCDIQSNAVKIFNMKTKRWKQEICLLNYDISSTYKDEIKHFLDCLEKNKKTINPVIDGEKVLQIALAILKSSKLKKMIKI